MKFRRYRDADEFKIDVLSILLEDEVLNNLPIGILIDGNKEYAADWLMATVTDDNGEIDLIAVCTKPFNLLLCKPSGSSGSSGSKNNNSIEFLAGELKSINFSPPGIVAPKELAEPFANAYCRNIKSKLYMIMTLMKLDELIDHKKVPGFCRMLNEDDLEYTPDWEHHFCIDCRIPVYTHSESYERIKTRIGKNIHYIWEDRLPVSQAVWGRNTPNSAAISWVYTPPEHRGKGYATAVVAELSKSILESGKTSCCLFADTANPASQAVYRKLGYYDVCEFYEIKFDMS